MLLLELNIAGLESSKFKGIKYLFKKVPAVGNSSIREDNLGVVSFYYLEIFILSLRLLELSYQVAPNL